MTNSNIGKMRKFLSAILALSLSISMTACGEKESDGLDTPAETQTTTITTVKEADVSETNNSEAEITTTTAQSNPAEESVSDESSSNNEKVDSSIIPYEVELGFTPGESYNTFLLRVKNNMHMRILNKDSSNGLDRNGIFYIDSPFKDSWKNEHNITFTELSPDNCKANSEYLVAEANEIESCKLKVEDGIYVSKFTYNGTEYKMRLGRSDKYSEREIQACQLAMRIPDYTTYFFMSYENGEYIVYPFMYSADYLISSGWTYVFAITPVWDLIGEYMDEVGSVLEANAQLDEKLDIYLAEQPDWVD